MKYESIEELKKKLAKKWSCSEIKNIGIGVSGGPDSMVLLSLICDLCKIENLKNLCIYVLTINHNIRNSCVSEQDSNFVLEWVDNQKKINPKLKIIAEKRTFEKGLVEKTAQKRKKGLEEAARFLRYNEFEEFSAFYKLNFFCTAHNENDQLETLLQRFLQGTSPVSAGGILAERDIFFRPLLQVSRNEILDYAHNNDIPYRIDETNNESVYFRNKIRNCLVPFLNENFEGWQTAVLHGAEKVRDLTAHIKTVVDSIDIKVVNNNEVEIPIDEFLKLDVGVRIQVLYSAFIKLGIKNRIPYRATKECAISLKMNKHGIYVKTILQKLVICYKLEKKDATCSSGLLAQNSNLMNGFFMLITKCGKYEIPKKFEFTVQYQKNNKSTGPFTFPLVIRNRQSADKVRGADGSLKKLSRIFSDWKVPEELRDEIPIIEAQNTIYAVMAAWCGYKDWLVSNQAFNSGVYISMRKL